MNVVVIGSGFGGIGMAIELRRSGITDVTVLERGAELGGTWFHNTYPGAACDVPSHLYSYSYAQRRDWTRICSPQEEILRYLQGVARDFGVADIVETDTEVEACTWSDEERRWTVTSTDGRSWEADAVVVATGQLHRKAVPAIEGLEDFGGHSFHSVEWDHDYDLRGKRVAVIGTGASAVQFVPEIVDDVQKLAIVQRTGNWFLPRVSNPYPGWLKWIFENVPGVQPARRRFIYHYGEFLTRMIRNPNTWGRLGHLRSSGFMRWQLRNSPEVKRKVWPDYTFGCKRVIFSSKWLPAIQKPNVEIVTDGIARATPTGIVTTAGESIDVDCIIYGTGFRTNDFMFPMEITGAEGRPLREEWEGGAHAHLGITVPGFPSLFLMYGPNTNTSGGSIIVYLEAQARYIRQAIAAVQERGAAALLVRRDVEERYDRDTQARFAGTAWTECDSWYRNESGRVIANWPGYMVEYEALTERLDPAHFEFVPSRDEQPATAA